MGKLWQVRTQCCVINYKGSNWGSFAADYNIHKTIFLETDECGQIGQKLSSLKEFKYVYHEKTTKKLI